MPNKMSTEALNELRSITSIPPIVLRPSTQSLPFIFSQLKAVSKERLDTTDIHSNPTADGEEIKGLKFIAAKLAKLFIKNRKLAYNEVSKILIDNFASENRDQRNIKRRVYDAINVLVATGVLVKKNNFVEIVESKLRTKILDEQKREKMERELDRCQRKIKEKSEKLKVLSNKTKIIEKLFNRNKKQLTAAKSRVKTQSSHPQMIQSPRVFICYQDRGHNENNSQLRRSSTKDIHSIVPEFSCRGSDSRVQLQIPQTQGRLQSDDLGRNRSDSSVMSFVDILNEQSFPDISERNK